MKKILFILLLAINSRSFSQQQYEKVALSGDLMLGDINKPIPLPFQQAIKVFLWYYPINDNVRVKLDVDELIKKEWYDNPGATKIRFYAPRDLFNKFYGEKNSSFSLTATFLYELPESHNIDSVSRYLTISINNNIPKPKIPNATIDINPIFLGEPERLTLTVMINDINQKLFSSTTNNAGFSNVVDKLERYMDDYYDNRKINYETLIDFYKLLIFTDEYVKDNSFFNQEGNQLSTEITRLQNQLSDTTGNNKNNVDKQNTMHDLFASLEVYHEYLKVYSKLKDYNSRLQLILFLKSK